MRVEDILNYREAFYKEKHMQSEFEAEGKVYDVVLRDIDYIRKLISKDAGNDAIEIRRRKQILMEQVILYGWEVAPNYFRQSNSLTKPDEETERPETISQENWNAQRGISEELRRIYKQLQ